MAYFILFTTTITYYLMIFSGLKSFSRYARLNKNYKIYVLLSLLLHSASLYLIQITQINTYLAFIVTLVLMFITFYVAFDGSIKFIYFGSIHHVFYLFTIRSMIYSVVSLVCKISISDLIANSLSSMYILQAAIIFASIYFIYLRKELLSEDKIQVLLRNDDQLNFILFTKTVLGLYVMVLAYGSKFTTNYRWFAFINFISAVIANSVAMESLKNGIRVSKIIEYESQTRLLKKQIDMQVNQYRSYQEYTENFREFRHDYKKMLSTVNALLRQGKTESAINILDKISVDMSTKVDSHHQYSNNPIIDAIMQDFANQCKNESISFNCVLFWDSRVKADELDLVRIFTNLMTNALEASKTSTKNKYINVESKINGNWLDVKIENQFDGVVRSELKTKKKDFRAHGLGMGIVEETVSKTGGIFSHEVVDDIFIAYVHFPIS